MSNTSAFEKMLADMNPQPGGEFIFTCLPAIPENVTPHAIIREPEGITVVIEIEAARQAALELTDTYTLLTLGSPGSLASVGLTASVAQVLSSRSIPCNVLSGVHHNHLFVPTNLAQDALSVLSEIQSQARDWLRF